MTDNKYTEGEYQGMLVITGTMVGFCVGLMFWITDTPGRVCLTILTGLEIGCLVTIAVEYLATLIRK